MPEENSFPGRLPSEGPVPAFEVWGRQGYESVVTLSEPVYTIGADDECTLVIDDPTVSRVHAIVERVSGTWLIRDLGARNGTRVNGEVVLVQHRLRDGDEVTLGASRLVFRSAEDAKHRPTDQLEAPPDNITPAEKRVLVQLCAPLLRGGAFTPPATRREIADALFVGEQAVQAHLTHLYDKFLIPADPGVTRRVVLANEAIRRGAVSLADLERASRDDRSG
jgi:hypothetical protein